MGGGVQRQRKGQAERDGTGLGAPRVHVRPPPSSRRRGRAGRRPGSSARMPPRRSRPPMRWSPASSPSTCTATAAASSARIPRPIPSPRRCAPGDWRSACLAIVSDSPTHRVFPDRTIHPVRDPEPGELYAWSKASFARLLAACPAQGLRVVSSTADLRAAPAGGPAIVVAAEGADFLEGRIERVDEARVQYGLRHLQLVHYRPNELGDIQTEEPVHNGLTDFGVEVVRACNRLGIVVDVAHATFEVVKRAAAATSRPLILSHTSLVRRAEAAQPADLRRPRAGGRADRRGHRRMAAGHRSFRRSTRWRRGWRGWQKSSGSTMSGSAATCAG